MIGFVKQNRWRNFHWRNFLWFNIGLLRSLMPYAIQETQLRVPILAKFIEMVSLNFRWNLRLPLGSTRWCPRGFLCLFFTNKKGLNVFVYQNKNWKNLGISGIWALVNYRKLAPIFGTPNILHNPIEWDTKQPHRFKWFLLDKIHIVIIN